MADLLARLAERTLGVAEVARPLTLPIFAPATPHAVEASSASSYVISPVHAPRPKPDVLPPLVPKTEHVPDTEDASFAPRRETPQSKRTDEDADPETATQPLSRVELAVRAALRQDAREPNDGSLEEPAAEPPRGAATNPRSPIVLSPPRQPMIATSAIERHTRNVSFEDRDRPGATGDAATSIDASDRRQRMPPVIAAPPRSSARPVVQETNRVRGHEQADSTIHVNIGRIEVRAVLPPSPTSPPARRTGKPALSLADYFKERDGGTR
jgi:hypothetical protein